MSDQKKKEAFNPLFDEKAIKEYWKNQMEIVRKKQSKEVKK